MFNHSSRSARRLLPVLLLPALTACPPIPPPTPPPTATTATSKVSFRDIGISVVGQRCEQDLRWEWAPVNVIGTSGLKTAQSKPSSPPTSFTKFTSVSKEVSGPNDDPMTVCEYQTEMTGLASGQWSITLIRASTPSFQYQCGVNLKDGDNYSGFKEGTSYCMHVEAGSTPVPTFKYP